MLARVNSFLRSEAATLLLLFLALAAQAPHAATVFHRLAPAAEQGHWLAWLHAGAYAVALELATLVFVVRGQQRLAWGFAGVSVLVNVAYYLGGGVAFYQYAPALLISIALPVAIATYSHDVARHNNADQNEASQQAHSAATQAATTLPAGNEDLCPSTAQGGAVGVPAPSTESPAQSPAQPQLRKVTEAAPEERRQRIQALKEQGKSNIQIAQLLGVHRNTVAADLRLHMNGTNGEEHA